MNRQFKKVKNIGNTIETIYYGSMSEEEKADRLYELVNPVKRPKIKRNISSYSIKPIDNIVSNKVSKC